VARAPVGNSSEESAEVAVRALVGEHRRHHCEQHGVVVVGAEKREHRARRREEKDRGGEATADHVEEISAEQGADCAR